MRRRIQQRRGSVDGAHRCRVRRRPSNTCPLRSAASRRRPVHRCDRRRRRAPARRVGQVFSWAFARGRRRQQHVRSLNRCLDGRASARLVVLEIGSGQAAALLLDLVEHALRSVPRGPGALFGFRSAGDGVTGELELLLRRPATASGRQQEDRGRDKEGTRSAIHHNCVG